MLTGVLADEYLEAGRFIERLSGMTAVSGSDMQAIATNECLELFRIVHLEIQRSGPIGLTGHFAGRLRSYDLSRRLIAGPCRNADTTLSLGAIVFIEHVLPFGAPEEETQIWNEDVDNEHASGSKVSFHAADTALEVFQRV